MRVARAVEALVVMQADVHRRGLGAARLDQQLVAARGVAPHHGELVVGELARLVQDLQRHQRLAQVVQQTGEAGAAALVPIAPHLARPRATMSAHTATECM